MKKKLILFYSMIGLAVALFIPICVLATVSAFIWGPETFRGLGSSHPSYWFILLLSPGFMAWAGMHYFIRYMIPLFARHQISAKEHGNTNFRVWQKYIQLARKHAESNARALTEYEKQETEPAG